MLAREKLEILREKLEIPKALPKFNQPECWKSSLLLIISPGFVVHWRFPKISLKNSNSTKLNDEADFWMVLVYMGGGGRIKFYRNHGERKFIGHRRIKKQDLICRHPKQLSYSSSIVCVYKWGIERTSSEDVMLLHQLGSRENEVDRCKSHL